MQKIRKRIFGGSGLMLASLAFSAAILPAVLMGALNPTGFSLITKATTPNQVRLWIEPAEVITKPGVEFALTVMADFESENMTVSKLDAMIKKDANIWLDSDEIHYQEPFRGAVEVGTVNVRADTVGQYSLEVDPGSVFVDLPDVNILSARTLIISKK